MKIRPSLSQGFKLLKTIVQNHRFVLFYDAFCVFPYPFLKKNFELLGSQQHNTVYPKCEGLLHDVLLDPAAYKVQKVKAGISMFK